MSEYQAVNYDDFAHTFSHSRNAMKWEEIEYFLQKYSDAINGKKILDIWCGNGRLLDHFIQSSCITDIDYFWIDSSQWMIQEAKNKFHTDDFMVWNMNELKNLKMKNFESVFFIASFHHLENIESRIQCLSTLKTLLLPKSFIFMTNWDLQSPINKEKYKNNKIKTSKNEFWSEDYFIKIGDFQRFYHSFSLQELEYIFHQTWFEILENRLFENERNIVSIIQ